MAEVTRPRPIDLPPSSPPANHGRTSAAWVTMIVITLGALICAVAVAAALPWLFWAGLVVIVLGLIAGKILQAMGFGQLHPQTARQLDAGSDTRH
jgi:hypothetical protein